MYEHFSTSPHEISYPTLLLMLTLSEKQRELNEREGGGGGQLKLKSKEGLKVMTGATWVMMTRILLIDSIIHLITHPPCNHSFILYQPLYNTLCYSGPISVHVAEILGKALPSEQLLVPIASYMSSSSSSSSSAAEGNLILILTLPVPYCTYFFSW